MAIATTYAGFHLASHFTGSLGFASFGASIGENLGFYGWMLVRDWQQSAKGLTSVIRNLLVEFGFAEVLDSFALRPLATFVSVTLFGQMTGVLTGKLAADLAFYLIAITMFERGKADSLVVRKP
jgi:hypothetical protein